MDKKKFLFYSYEGSITDIAWRVAKEGHDVKVFIFTKQDKDTGDGFVEKTENWEKEAENADVVVFDDVEARMGEAADLMRKKGKLVIGSTSYTNQLEDDRSFGQEELKRFGINIIPYHDFTSFDEAIKFVKEHPDQYVIKPSGEAQNAKMLLFVGEEEDGRDVVQVLEAYKKLWSSKIKNFQLQKRVNGVEMAVGAFFNGHSFVHPVNINFEHKKLFPGNIGPSTGEMGTAMFWSKPNKIFNFTLQKMEEKLKAEKYVGYIDLNCIVNGYGIYPLEFTARFGFPTIYIQQEGIMMPMAEFLFGLAEGSMESFKTRSGFQVGVQLVVPPFPYGDGVQPDVNSRDAVVIFKKPSWDGVHIQYVKLIDNECVVAGYYGATFTVVGVGPTMKQAQNQAYSRINNILIPNMYYRKDIGDRWYEDSDRLHNWGYLREV